jgi:hypothetical protein
MPPSITDLYSLIYLVFNNLPENNKIIQIVVQLFITILEECINKIYIVPIICDLLLYLSIEIRMEILKRMPIDDLFHTFIDKRIEDNLSKDNLIKLIDESISDICEYCGTYKIIKNMYKIYNTIEVYKIFNLNICENEDIFSYNLYCYFENGNWFINLEIYFIHPILISKIDQLIPSINRIIKIDSTKIGLEYIYPDDRLLNKLKYVYSIKMKIELFIFNIYSGHHILDNLFTHISYHSKVYIEENWSLYCYWKGRIEYLSLIDKAENETHITHYLFNDFVMRDICSYLHDNKILLQDPDDELDDEFI